MISLHDAGDAPSSPGPITQPARTEPPTHRLACSVTPIQGTLPRWPVPNRLQPSTPLDRAGKALDDARAAFCLDRNQGLTATYNAPEDPTHHDPEVLHLRELHLAKARAVIEAYGWQSLPVPKHLTPTPNIPEATETIPLPEALLPYTDPTTEEETRAFQRFEDTIIDQLFALNALRAAEESHRPPRPPAGVSSGQNPRADGE